MRESPKVTEVVGNDLPKPSVPLPTATRTPLNIKRLTILDGNTLELPDGNRLRLIGSDARHELVVTGIASFFSTPREIEIEKDAETLDETGRSWVYFYGQDRMLNLHLVENGLALASIVPPNTRYKELFIEAERTAKAAKRGIWAERELATEPERSDARDSATPPGGYQTRPRDSAARDSYGGGSGGRCGAITTRGTPCKKRAGSCPYH
jgi:hypothetical protein